MILRIFAPVLVLFLPPPAAAAIVPPAGVPWAAVATPAQSDPVPPADAAPQADSVPEATAPATTPATPGGAATEPAPAAPETPAPDAGTTATEPAPAAPAQEEAPAAGAPDAAPAAPVPATPPSGNVIVAPEPTESSLPTILRAEADMPEPVRRTWQRLMEAARSGDIERLRPLMEEQKEPPDVAFDAELDDPIDYLRSLSGDAEGREILAILLEVLEAGFLHVDAGTPQELYVWPYFAQYPMEALTAEQMVEMFTLLTAADYQEMRSYGAYIFFRLGIAPDGTWRFFVAGD